MSANVRFCSDSLRFDLSHYDSLHICGLAVILIDLPFHNNVLSCKPGGKHSQHSIIRGISFPVLSVSMIEHRTVCLSDRFMSFPQLNNSNTKRALPLTLRPVLGTRALAL
jgi:hypothetical protein